VVKSEVADFAEHGAAVGVAAGIPAGREGIHLLNRQIVEWLNRKIGKRRIVKPSRRCNDLTIQQYNIPANYKSA
jgi:hypothetical protein